MQRFIFISLAACFAVAGCGSKSKLTSEQKQEFSTTLEASGRAQKVGKTGAEASGRTGEISDAKSSKQTDIESKLYSKMQGSSCDYKFQEPPKGFDQGGGFQMPSTTKVEWSVEGAGCPLTMKFSSEFGMSGIKLDISFKITDEELKNLNDVYAMTLKGEVKSDPQAQSASGSFKGSLSSVTLGEIPMSVDVSGNKDRSEQTMTWEMPKYTVEIKVVQTGKTIEYSLNGESMTEQEFKDLLQKGGEALSQAGGDQKQTKQSQQSQDKPAHTTQPTLSDDGDGFTFPPHS